MCLFVDLETYSPVPIKNGTHAYAEQAEILLFAWAFDDETVSVWDPTAGEPMPERLRCGLGDPTIELWALNSVFDRTILRYCLPGVVAGGVSRWRDTMIQALAHSLPGSLGKLCEALKIPQDEAKDKDGKRLIMLFCKPQPKNRKIRRATRDTHPEDWQRFKVYAGRDIDAMRAIKRILPAWNYNGFELDLWHLDQEINDRGFCVDVELATAAVTAVNEQQKRLAEQTQALTDQEVQAATQRDAMLQHIAKCYDVQLPDMQKSTLQAAIADPDLPDIVRELLTIRLQACTTSTSKYKALLKSVSADGRLRNTLQFCGANRTGRWSGRIFQPQNLPRPTLKQPAIDFGIDCLKSGVAFELCDDVMQLTSAAVRACIKAPTGKKLVVSDLSNIEGRVLAWLAGEAWKIKAFKDIDAGIGHDMYKQAYSKSFSVDAGDVTKSQRQIGKVQELALGYEGGVGAFIAFSLVYRIDLEAMAEAALPGIPQHIRNDALKAYEWASSKNKTYGLSKRAYVVCDAFKRLWRQAHPATSSFWHEIENVVRRAIENPDKTFVCRRVKIRRSGTWLRILLPSGRYLCYPGICLDDRSKISYMGVNPYTRKWQRLHTYGGKIVENITQATARDILAHNLPTIEKAGYSIVLTVHDEVITETPDTPNYTEENLSAMLATNPPWADGLPLAAGGFEAPYYRKED